MSAALLEVLGWLRPYRGRMALAALLQTATVAAAVGLMATSAWLISAAALHPSIAALQLSIVGVRFFGIARGVMRYLERLVAHDVTLRILAALRVRIFGALESAGPLRFSPLRSGDVLSRLVADVETLEGVYVRVIGPSVAAAAIVVLLALLLWTYDALLAAVALAGAVAAGILVPWLAWRAGSAAGARTVPLRAEVAARLVDAVQGAADLTSLGRAASHADEANEVSRALGRSQLQASRPAAAGSALMGLSADLTAFAVLAAALALVARNAFDPINLALVGLATLAAFEAVSALPAAYQGLGAVASAAQRVNEVLDEAVLAEPERAAAAAVPGRSLEVRSLTYRYPGSAREVLHDVSLSLGAGRPVALVGPSGSGKSTLAHLLMRLAEPPTGTIFLDGIDITSLPEDVARARLSLVAQRTHLFAATVTDNLRLARPAATDDDLHDAVRRSGLEPVVAALPQGAHTWLGEQGLRLSGGERQRLALARGLLKDAPILVCDEPTSHLDPSSARLVLDELYRLAQERPLLVITHQLAGLEPMAEIVVLQAGRVVERGPFAELAAAGGLFSRMLRLERDVL